jgi:hypothetical protein
VKIIVVHFMTLITVLGWIAPACAAFGAADTATNEDSPNVDSGAGMSLISADSGKSPGQDDSSARDGSFAIDGSPDASPDATPACDPCATGWMCTGGQCVPRPEGIWSITLLSGTMASLQRDGGSWNDDGLPDPSVCATPGGSYSRCSSSQPDTLSPAWNVFLLEASAKELFDGSVLVDIHNGADVIPKCAGIPLRALSPDFAAGQTQTNCSVASIKFSIVYQR